MRCVFFYLAILMALLLNTCCNNADMNCSDKGYEEECGKEIEFSTIDVKSELNDNDFSLTDSKLYTVNSLSELKEIISSNTKLDNIDFTNNTLFLLRKTELYGVVRILPKFYKTGANKYNLKIDISLNEATVPEKWVLAITTAKIRKGSVSCTLNYANR